MSDLPSGPPARLRIGLVGGGRGGLALLDLLLDWPEARVAVVVDRRPSAPAVAKARSLAIPTGERPLDAFEHPVDLVFEVTGQPAVLAELLDHKPPSVEVIGSGGLRFFWNLLQDRVKATRRMTVQLDMAGALGSVADPKYQIAIAIQKLAQACAVDRCAFLSVDEESGAVTPVTAQFATGETDERQWAAFRALRNLGIRDLPFLDEILGRRGPLEIENAETSALMPAGWSARFGIKSMLVVPTLRKDHVVGVCLLDYCREPQRFSQEQITVALALAGQVSLAYENSRLYRRAEERADKLAALSTVTRLMTSVHERHRVFRAIAQAAVTLLGATTARVWVDDVRERMLRTQSGFSVDARIDELLGEVKPIPYGQGVIGRIFISRRPEYIGDIGKHPRWLNRQLATEGGLHGFAGIPLISGDQAVGVLSILFREERRFTHEEQEYIRLLGDQAAIALENVQLYETLEERAARLRTLARLNRIVSSSLDMREVLTGIARAAAEIMRAPFVSFWLVDAATRTLRVGAVSEEATWAGHPTDARSFDEAGIMGVIARERRPIGIADVASDPRVIAPEWFRANGFSSYYGIPIVADDAVLAVLNFNGRAPFEFLPVESEALQAFVAQAAAATRNAWLYEDLKLAHQRLAQSQAQLIHSEKLSALGQLVAGVAHELNNPLAAMLGYAYLAERKDDPATLKQYVAQMRLSAERAAQIVRNLLQFARETTPTREILGVNELVERVLNVTANTLVTNNIVIVRELDPAAPATAGDAGQLQQVLFNLVTNAYQAMAGVGGTLTVRTRAAGAVVRVEVADTGPGVPTDVRAKIFDPFFTTKPVGTGTGLGLSVAHGIVAAHGGRIWLDDTVESGATFVLELPRASGQPPPPPTAPPPVPTGRRILVVDDEPPVAKVLADLLTELGSTVTVASSAHEARAVLDRESYDLVTLDLVMPGESGADFFRWLREARREVSERVVFVTGAAEPALQRFIESTGRLVLAKPFTLDRLTEMLHRALTPPADSATSPPR